MVKYVVEPKGATGVAGGGAAHGVALVGRTCCGSWVIPKTSSYSSSTRSAALTMDVKERRRSPATPINGDLHFIYARRGSESTVVSNYYIRFSRK